MWFRVWCLGHRPALPLPLTPPKPRNAGRGWGEVGSRGAGVHVLGVLKDQGVQGWYGACVFFEV